MNTTASTNPSNQAELLPVRLGEKFEITAQGLTVKGRPTFDDFEALGEVLRTLDKGLQFAIGDFFRESEAHLHEKASQILDHTGWSEETVRAYRWTATKVPQENRRMDVLSYSHHQSVAKLSPREQKRWLTKAVDGDDGKPWPVKRLTQAIKAGTDVATTSWIVVAFCESERDRDKLLSELESRGIKCKASERHAVAA